MLGSGVTQFFDKADKLVKGGPEARLSRHKVPKPLPVDVRTALEAICAYGKGRCWYCDVKVPAADRALRAGWDVQRIEEQPVASIILVCPKCARRKAQLGEAEFNRRITLDVPASTHRPRTHSGPAPQVRPGSRPSA
jgi:hypothetical protein